jgi:hypothetical protein
LVEGTDFEVAVGSTVGDVVAAIHLTLDELHRRASAAGSAPEGKIDLATRLSELAVQLMAITIRDVPGARAVLDGSCAEG